MSSAAAVTRARSLLRPINTLRDPRPASLRGVWHRASMLGSLALLLVFPWLSSRGCEGTSAPTTWTGYELLQHTLSDEALWAFAPLALLVAAALPFASTRVRSAGRRLLLHVAALVLSLGGAFFTFVALEVPTGGDVVDHHAASALGVAALLAFMGDAVVRTVLGARELWVGRRRSTS